MSVAPSAVTAFSECESVCVCVFVLRVWACVPT